MSNPSWERVLRYFEYSHLPEKLQAYSKPFHLTAHEVVKAAESGATDAAEVTVALRKLLEAKDAAVRAFL